MAEHRRETSRKATYRKRAPGPLEPKRATHPRYPWMVDTKEGSRRVRRYFDDFRTASAFAETQNIKLENLGRRIDQLTGAELEDAIAARRDVEAMGFPSLAEAVRELRTARELLDGTGRSLVEAARDVAQRCRAEAASQAVTKAVEDLIASKRAGGASKDYLRDLTARLGTFAATFGDRQLCSISGSEIESWLHGHAWSPASIALMRRNLSVLWSFARRRGWVAENTILERTEAPKVRLATPKILRPEEWGQLVAAAEARAAATGEHGLLWWLLLGGLQGLRPREAERLEWRHIRRAMGDLELDATVTKTGTRRLVPILPAFAAFLDRYQPANATGPLVPLSTQQLRDRRESACVDAGLTWSPDVLRHSWCSYRVAQIGDAGRVAYEAGHSQAVQNRHYRELVHSAEADKWFAVRPAPEPDHGSVIAFTTAN